MAWIYELIIKTTNEIYIGKTKGTIPSRLGKHKLDYKRTSDKFIYQRIREEGGWSNVQCNPIIECFERDLDELEKYYISQVPTELSLNTQHCSRYTSSYSRRIDIDWNKVVKEYEEGYSSNQLASKYNCNASSIQYNIRKHGGTLRKQIPLSKEVLEDLYINKQLSSLKIAKQFNLTKTRVLQLLRDYNIPRRSNKDAQLVRNNK